MRVFGGTSFSSRLPQNKMTAAIQKLIYNKFYYFFYFWIAVFLFRGYPRHFLQPGYKTTAIQKLIYKKSNFTYFYIVAVVYPVYRLPGNTIWSLYPGCRMALQQVKIRLPRRRDSHAIIRSHKRPPQEGVGVKTKTCKNAW